MRRTRIAIAIVLVLAVMGAGYYLYRGKPQQASQKAAMPPAEVGVVAMRKADVPLPLTYAGRVAGFRSVEIRAQVGGIILKREFMEGATVKQGDVLFRIDPRSYQAALDRANAQLSQAQATQTQAEENFRRIEDLSQKQVATAKQLEDARASRDLARAAIQGAQADIETAKLNIEFTKVVAPVTGPTSLTSPPEGSLAQAQQTDRHPANPVDLLERRRRPVAEPVRPRAPDGRVPAERVRRAATGRVARPTRPVRLRRQFRQQRRHGPTHQARSGSRGRLGREGWTG